MKISYEWLKEYVDTHSTAEELGTKFLMTSSELEGLEAWGEMLKNVVVGEVLTCVPHPNASKLSKTTVTVGGRKKLQIICGASNVAAGCKVLVALPGAVVRARNSTETYTITTATLRGEVSEGMLCAAEELGLAPQGDGIMILPPSAKNGTSAAAYLNRETSVLDLEITPNRPDLLSYVGLAREVSAFERRSFSEPPLLPLENLQNLPSVLTTASSQPQLCQSFAAMQFKKAHDATTPVWMRARLELSGISVINPIVDIANYVMLELGQPLHTYACEALPKSASQKYDFLATTPKTTTQFTGIDGVERTLQPEDACITMQGNVIAIAGIMGSRETSITPTTEEFFLESASFHGPAIRRTSRRLGLRTEASGRFEKGVDPELVVTAIKRAAYLYQKLGIAQPVSRLVDFSSHKKNSGRARIHVTADQIQSILGVHISLGEAKLILQKLGFTLLHVTKASLDCIPPSWRADVTREEDILEELLRIWGYDRVPNTLPSGAVKKPQENPRFRMVQALRHKAAAFGFMETIHLSFTNKREMSHVGYPVEEAIPLQNPLSQEQSHLIPTHLISFLRTIAANQAQAETRLFEVGSVFRSPTEEISQFSVCLRSNTQSEALIQEMKGLIENLLIAAKISSPITYNEINVDNIVDTDAESANNVPYANIMLNNISIGKIEKISPATLELWKIRRAKNMLFTEIYLDVLAKIPKTFVTYQPLPVYPGIERHVTIQVAESINWQYLEGIIAKHQASLQHNLTMSYAFQAVYRGKPLPAGTKSFTVQLTYNHAQRTLTDQEVEQDLNLLLKKITKLPAIIAK